MTRLSDNKNFIADIQNLGKSILANTRFIHDVAEFRKGLRQEVATAHLKCHILERKGKRGEEVIEYLVNKIDRNKITEVCERMKTMGIQIDVNTSKNERSTSDRHKPSPRSKPGFIYIDE
jgi:aspartate oxidase